MKRGQRGKREPKKSSISEHTKYTTRKAAPPPMDATEGSDNRFDGQTVALATHKEATDDMAKNSKHGKKM